MDNSSVIDASLLKDLELTKVGKNKFVLGYKDRVFYIGELLFDVLGEMKAGASLEEARQRVGERFSVSLEASELKESLRACTDKLEKREKMTSTLRSYIYFKINLFKERTVDLLAKPFRFLHKQVLVIVLCVTSLLSALYFGKHILETGLFSMNVGLKDGTVFFALNYLFIFLMALFHEIGHASAALKYKVKPKSIGFGFYLVFPVFFTDVTQVWKLSKWKRISVNLAGIYFQLIINLLLIGLFFALEMPVQYQVLLKSFFLTNIGLVIYAINPFLRNDGYWVYSDLFNLPNLNDQAKNFPVELVTSVRKNGIGQLFKKTFGQLPLFMYSMAFYCVMSLLVVGLYFLSLKNYQAIAQVVRTLSGSKNIFTLETISEALKVGLAVCINVFFFIRIGKFYFFKLINR